MRRREFIAGLGSAAAWPLAARGQQAALPVIGLLSGVALTLGNAQRPMIEGSAAVANIRKGLNDVGFVMHSRARPMYADAGDEQKKHASIDDCHDRFARCVWHGRRTRDRRHRTGLLEHRP
jgi:hypothetical protein